MIRMSKFGDKKQVSRFWQKVRIGGPNDCWNWTANKCGNYGQTNVERKMQYAHRVAWCLANGRRLDEPRVIRHSCDNPLCVNPRHLFDGTQADNIQDCSTKARISHAEQHGNAKLTDDQVREIRRLRKAGVRAVDIASKYGIDRSQVYRIANFESRARYINNLS